MTNPGRSWFHVNFIHVEKSVQRNKVYGLTYCSIKINVQQFPYFYNTQKNLQEMNFHYMFHKVLTKMTVFQ